MEDSSSWGDADWAELNKLKRAHQKGGQRALAKAVDKLSEGDRGSYIRIIAAFFSSMVRNAAKDAMAEPSVTEEDRVTGKNVVRSAIRKDF